jgi:hypothetical protein
MHATPHVKGQGCDRLLVLVKLDAEYPEGEGSKGDVPQASPGSPSQKKTDIREATLDLIGIDR